jgi:hypothetical protein
MRCAEPRRDAVVVTFPFIPTATYLCRLLGKVVTSMRTPSRRLSLALLIGGLVTVLALGLARSTAPAQADPERDAAGQRERPPVAVGVSLGFTTTAKIDPVVSRY